ncbi:succinate dehydrogenase cytochrome b556 subunit [Candidatus Rickettsiella viridis]|uniref:Succinate dehydrogenase cytochrome b556 subunit n=1 Tax=Candidatus Rickettsiella viridis TaxID=676208 RepID=A0A2Z5V402_9COXI|nr:succinate dehydrogenase, cytochrome b556 subunit [Candidatus Rickettsiella viridis]BBB15172.1 succinate dehydrogenase cytochrome b556 subunit [Candidatus Rickettsiella viridis]
MEQRQEITETRQEVMEEMHEIILLRQKEIIEKKETGSEALEIFHKQLNTLQARHAELKEKLEQLKGQQKTAEEGVKNLNHLNVKLNDLLKPVESVAQVQPILYLKHRHLTLEKRLIHQSFLFRSIKIQSHHLYLNTLCAYNPPVFRLKLYSFKADSVAKRPVNLNLLTLRFPITAIASILHRVSGFILFLFIPVFLGFIAVSLRSPEGFFLAHNVLTHPLAKLMILAIFFALFYHMLAGIRHLIMDTGLGETLSTARFTAGLVMCLAIVLTTLMGIYLC